MDIFFNSCSEAIEHANKTSGFGCFYSEMTGTTTDIHVHECCEILFCISGSKTIFIGDRVYEANDGDVFLLNPFEAHKITSDRPIFKRFVMQVHPAFLYNNSTPDTDLSLGFYTRGEFVTQKLSLKKDEILRMNSFMERLKSDHGFGDDVLKQLCALEMIVFLNKIFSEKNKNHPHRYSFENKTVEQSLRFINSNLASPLSLEIIAKNSYISVNELCRLFKKHLGTTVTKYILSKRITEAKKLLTAGNSVGDTAHSCGFQDYANFIRSFKKIVGVSPGRYAASTRTSD